MKKLILFLVFIITTLQFYGKAKEFEIKFGHIQYTTKSPILNSTQDFYFDNFGSKTMVQISKSTRLISKSNFTYTVNDTEKTYTKEKDEEAEEEMFYDLSSNAKKIGKEKILDKTCDIYEDNTEDGNFKLWIWKGIPLKMVATSYGQTMELVAVKLSLKDVSKSLFEIPANYSEKSSDTEDFDNISGDLSPEDLEKLQGALNDMKGMFGE